MNKIEKQVMPMERALIGERVKERSYEVEY
jgi:hypothetical protein